MARNDPGDATEHQAERPESGSEPVEPTSQEQASRAPEQRREPEPQPEYERPRTTRTSAAWVTIAIGVVLLVLLLVFILQNQQPVDVSYFAATGRLPLGVALLLAAAAGAAVVVIVGAARILQLRAYSRRQRHRTKKAARATK